MNSAITDDSTSRAERAFRMHLSLFTNPAMIAEAYANLLTEDVVQEYPFAPAPFPNRVEGREAVTSYMVNVTQLATNWSFTDFTFSAPSDPDTLFVEFKGGAFVTATGKMYQQVYIGRIQCSFGLMGMTLYAGNSVRLKPHLPLLTGGLIAFYLLVELPFSGMSLNPARSFAGALAGHNRTGLWVYFVAPPAAMLLAAGVFRRWKTK